LNLLSINRFRKGRSAEVVEVSLPPWKKSIRREVIFLLFFLPGWRRFFVGVALLSPITPELSKTEGRPT